MSTSEQTPAPSQQQQQQQRVRKPPFADWPTIKILTPPQGRFSPKTDEWCFTYCSQSVSGRFHGKEPSCRSVCLRRVFPHEVRNILSFHRHNEVGPDGKAKYPLPVEGQPSNLPRILGGTPKNDSDDQPSSTSASPIKHWDEGWYVWTGKGKWTVLQKTEEMMLDFQRQRQLEQIRQKRKDMWLEQQDQMKQNGGELVGEQRPRGPPWWTPLVPPKSVEDTSSLSLLVPLPPDFPPLLDKIKKFLEPSQKVLNIFYESISSGEQKQFALRVWEKAKTDEPFILAQRTCSHVYEQWKKHSVAEEDDGKKGSP
ncbi:hypothetical protein JR316_0001940 [Psilocybe cubensis]|uniref:Uncharacterized protein n=2 Tax=Psilocybe cubensis TaxID=181762 RepID=A0ACB8HC32_PSICU|nr:hypothetical protein JR316_0001940 [Psilocybe cubensis]KAH9485036.1 hypothetical protein JR316_0001940 [Psilocybe cubensis]